MATENRTDSAKKNAKSQSDLKGHGSTVKDVMTPNPKTVTEKNTVQDAARLMRDHDTGVIPVVSDNGRKVVGMITDRDIVTRLVADGKDAKNSKVSEAMTRKVHSVRDNEPLNKVFQVMSDQQVRRVPVVNESNELVGIISLADVANETEKDKQLAKTVENISEPTASAKKR